MKSALSLSALSSFLILLLPAAVPIRAVPFKLPQWFNTQTHYISQNIRLVANVTDSTTSNHTSSRPLAAMINSWELRSSNFSSCRGDAILAPVAGTNNSRGRAAGDHRYQGPGTEDGGGLLFYPTENGKLAATESLSVWVNRTGDRSVKIGCFRQNKHQLLQWYRKENLEILNYVGGPRLSVKKSPRFYGCPDQHGEEGSGSGSHVAISSARLFWLERGRDEIPDGCVGVELLSKCADGLPHEGGAASRCCLEIQADGHCIESYDDQKKQEKKTKGKEDKNKSTT